MRRIREGCPKALIIPLVAAALVASGCGSSGSGSSQAESPKPAEASATKGARSVTVAVTNLPMTADLDPRSSSNSILSQNVGDSIAGTLFGYEGSPVNPDTASRFPAPMPELATSATPSADGLTWTFQLRPNVVSQDGNRLTSADVVYSIKRVIHDAQSGANLLTNIHIDSADPVTATGPLSVQVHLKAPSSLVVKTFSVSFLAILDEKAIAAHSPAGDPWGYAYLRSHSAGFGPYEVAVEELPDKEVISANPHYWQGAPQITKATFVQISDDSTRLEAVLSGQVDFAIAQSISDLPKVKASPAVQAELQPNVNLEFYLVFVVKSPIVQNPVVRRALSLVVDRDQIIRVGYSGAAKAVRSCVPSSLYSAPSSLSNYNPANGNLAEAKKLLAQAHMPTSISFGYPVAIPGSQALAEVVQSNFQSLGVQTTLAPYTSYPTFLADQASGKFSVALEGVGPSVQDAGYLMYTTTDGNASYDLGGYDNTALNTALATVETVSGSARQAALATACRLELQQAPVGPLVVVDGLGVASAKFTTISSLEGAPLLFNMRLR